MTDAMFDVIAMGLAIALIGFGIGQVLSGLAALSMVLRRR